VARHDRPCRNFGEFGDHECVHRCEIANLNTSLNASINVSAKPSINGRASGLGKTLSVVHALFLKDRAIFQNFTRRV